MLKRTWIIILAAFIMSCATADVAHKTDTRKTAAEKSKSIFDVSPSDADILKEALACLKNEAGGPDYYAARAQLEFLVQEYPKSKWIDGAGTLIQTINNLLAMQLKSQTEKQYLDKANADKVKLLREKEVLKREYKLLEEKYQTESVKLQQENEQLKKDITILKKLEIQMDKREKMLK